ncbi:FKBP C domain containing protein, partial [Asbolus verrucosus]
DVAEGGTVFEVKYEVKDDTGQPEYLDGIESFTKLKCLDLGNQDDGGEPFDNIAKKKWTTFYKTNSLQTHPFDSTYARKKPFSFVIVDGQVIEGLEIAILSMKLNEKSHFLIVPELAFRNGGLNRIPPNSTVLFEIELCGLMESVLSSPVDTSKNDFDHVYKFCLAQCVKGKRMFRVKNYHGAIKEYTVAVYQLEKVVLKNYEEQEKSDE